jgi:uncharacterized membrane protein YccC
LNHRFQISLAPANQSTVLGRLKTTFAAILVAVIALAILAAALILGSLIATAIGIAIAIALAVGVVKVALQRSRPWTEPGSNRTLVRSTPPSKTFPQDEDSSTK